jgi:hypothetical protein
MASRTGISKTQDRQESYLINPLRLSSKYVLSSTFTISDAAFCIYLFRMIFSVNSITQLIFVMMECGVIFGDTD